MKKFSRSGFTLAEMAVALAAVAILTVGGAWLAITALRMNTIVWDQLSGQHDARRALAEITDTVRRVETSSIGGFPIALADENEFIVYANINEDQLRERVRFTLESGNLIMGITAPTGSPLVYNLDNEVETVIAADLQNSAAGIPLFSYFDENYTGVESPLTTPTIPTVVRLVRISLYIERNPLRSPIPILVQSMVQLRNLKTN